MSIDDIFGFILTQRRGLLHSEDVDLFIKNLVGVVGAEENLTALACEAQRAGFSAGFKVAARLYERRNFI